MKNTNITDSKPLSTRLKFGISAVLLVFIAIGCVPLYLGIQGIREAHESVSWPTVPGRITKSQLAVSTHEVRDRDRGQRRRTSNSYSAGLVYEFKLDDGLPRLGSRISVVSDQIGDEAYAKALLEKYPVGREVTVSYKPGQPEECVLEPGRWGGVGFQFLFAGAFIILPLGFLRIIWNPAAADTDPHRGTKAERQRFGLEFRERFLEWEPGNRIHLHRDHLGLISIVAGALVAGLILGAIIGLPLAMWLFSAKGTYFIAQIYAAVSLVLAIAGGIWFGLDNRRRDTMIDWGRETVRAQVGWSAREFTFDEIQELTLRIPDPKKPSPSNSTDTTATYAARILLIVRGKRYILLEVQCQRDELRRMRGRLRSIAEELAASLKVSVS